MVTAQNNLPIVRQYHLPDTKILRDVNLASLEVKRDRQPLSRHISIRLKSKHTD